MGEPVEQRRDLAVLRGLVLVDQHGPALHGPTALVGCNAARDDEPDLAARALGIDVTPCPLRDHADFDILPWEPEVRDLLVTEKDAVKLPPGMPLGATRVWVATLDWRLPRACEEALLRLPGG